MRIRRTLATFALAAGAAITGVAAAAPAAQANPQDGLVNVYVDDVLSGNQVVLLQNVPVDVVATVCGISADVLSSELLSGDKAECVTKSSSAGKAWVIWS